MMTILYGLTPRPHKQE